MSFALYMAIIAILSYVAVGAAYALAFLLALLLLPFKLLLMLPKLRHTAPHLRRSSNYIWSASNEIATVVRAEVISWLKPEQIEEFKRRIEALRDMADPDAPKSRPQETSADEAVPLKMKKEPYFIETERLFSAWMDARPLGGQLSAKLFSLRHAPEPYLLFGEGPRCVFVSTNPGDPLEVQLPPWENSNSLLKAPKTYAEAAAILGAFYSSSHSPINTTARNRIKAMRRIALLFGCSQLMQVEAIPWHSKSAENKEAMLAGLRREDADFLRYEIALKAFLRKQPIVFALSAGVPERRHGQGMSLKAELIDLDLESANILPLKYSPTGISQALLWSRQGERLRGLFVTQGQDVLPRAPSPGYAGVDHLIATIAH